MSLVLIVISDSDSTCLAKLEGNTWTAAAGQCEMLGAANEK